MVAGFPQSSGFEKQGETYCLTKMRVTVSQPNPRSGMPSSFLLYSVGRCSNSPGSGRGCRGPCYRLPSTDTKFAWNLDPLVQVVKLTQWLSLVRAITVPEPEPTSQPVSRFFPLFSLSPSKEYIQLDMAKYVPRFLVVAGIYLVAPIALTAQYD